MLAVTLGSIRGGEKVIRVGSKNFTEQQVLGKLYTVLNDESMRELNYQVDSLGRSPDEVAREFLVEHGLI